MNTIREFFNDMKFQLGYYWRRCGDQVGALIWLSILFLLIGCMIKYLVTG